MGVHPSEARLGSDICDYELTHYKLAKVCSVLIQEAHNLT